MLILKIILICLITLTTVHGDLNADESAVAGKGSAAAVTAAGAKLLKGSSAGAIAKGAGGAAFQTKGLAKKGAIAGGAAKVAGFKKGGAAKGGAAIKKFGKSGFKKGAFKKIIGVGHDKKFAKLIYGHDKGFKFATITGAGASGGKMGGLTAKKGFAAAGGSSAFKKGKKGFKKEFAATAGAKGAIKKGAFAKGGFNKGGLVKVQGIKKAAKAAGGVAG